MSRPLDEIRRVFELCNEFGVSVYEDGDFRVAFNPGHVMAKNEKPAIEQTSIIDEIKPPEGADPRLIEFWKTAGGNDNG